MTTITNLEAMNRKILDLEEMVVRLQNTIAVAQVETRDAIAETKAEMKEQREAETKRLSEQIDELNKKTSSGKSYFSSVR